MKTFTIETLEEFKDETIVVKFGAEWCNPCKSMTPVMKQLDSEGFPVFEVDVMTSPEMTVEYSIKNLPTTIVFKNKQEVKRVFGAQMKQQLLELLNL